MKQKLSIISINLILLLLFTLSLVIFSCGEPSIKPVRDEGLVTFKIKWKDAVELRPSKVDCNKSNIFTVEASVYDENDSYLVKSGPHDCEKHSGELINVKTGSDRKVVIVAKNEAGGIIFRGESGPVTVVSGETVNAGTITAESFLPELASPSAGRKVTYGNLRFQWKPVPGAVEYQLQCSEDNSFSNNVIEETLTNPNFTPDYSFLDKTYYWRVRATGKYGNISGWSGGYFESSSLVAYYPFNGNADDESGNGNHGTVYGATLAADRFDNKGSAYSFDGVGDYIKVANDISLNPDSITVSVWVYYYSPAPMSHPQNSIISKMKGSGTGYGLGDGYYNGGGRAVSYGESSFTLSTSPNGYNSVSSKVSPQVNNWIHLVGTYENNTNIANIYINGQNMSSRVIQGAIRKDNNELTIGVHPNFLKYPNDVIFFNGLIDDIRIYNRALSEAEIKDLYNEVPTDLPDPIAPPVNVSASSGDSETTISWDNVPGADTYNIYWAKTSGVTRDNSTIISNVSNPYTHTGLDNGTTYYYIITAEDSRSVSSESAEVSGVPDACGSKIQDSDGNTYNTVLIGDQCWMAENLNVGIMLSTASMMPLKDNNVEKWCYDNNEANCTTDGGLYTWNEAMGYVTNESAQGICPVGWHIPTDAEWYVLESGLATGSCSSTRDLVWDCAPAGTVLKKGGSLLGFDGLLAGYRSIIGSFVNRTLYTNLWSSVESGYDAWRHELYSDGTTVYRSTVEKEYGFSIRCLKN